MIRFYLVVLDKQVVVSYIYLLFISHYRGCQAFDDKWSAVVIKKVQSLSQEKLKEMLCLNVYWSVEKISSMCKHLFETFE